MTLFQYYFISYNTYDDLSKRLSQMNITIILFSLCLLLMKPVSCTMMSFLINIPFIEMILLIGSY